jgi:hypothetical protein
MLYVFCSLFARDGCAVPALLQTLRGLEGVGGKEKGYNAQVGIVCKHSCFSTTRHTMIVRMTRESSEYPNLLPSFHGF